MYTLAFDTTANGCSVALLQENRVLEKYVATMDYGQAEVLMPQINRILSNHGLKFADISLLAVCIGPGSFTGVRSSLAAARAFAMAQPRMKITGVSAFEAYQHSLAMNELSAINAIIIETKRDDFYFQMFNGRSEKLCEPQALNYEQIIEQLKGNVVTLIGSGVERFLDKPSGLVLHAVRMDECPDIADIAACALQKYKAGRLNYPKPLYLRAPDVCVKA